MLIQLIGWIASVCFALCGLPQAIVSYRDGHSKGLSSSFLILWGTGELLMIVYILGTIGWDGPIMANLIVNAIFVGIMCKYKWWPRR